MGDRIEEGGVYVQVRSGVGLVQFGESTHRDPDVRAFDNQIFDAQYDHNGNNTGATICVPESCYQKCGSLGENLGKVALDVLKSAGGQDEFTHTIVCDGWRRFKGCQSLTELYRSGRLSGIMITDRPFHQLKSGTARDYAMRAVINFGAEPTNLVDAARKIRK